MILPGQAPPDKIIVHQVAQELRVTQHGQPDTGFEKLDQAVQHAIQVSRGLRHLKARVVVLRNESPWMWD